MGKRKMNTENPGLLGLKRLERLARYLSETVEGFAYKQEADHITFTIENAGMDEKKGIVYIYSNYIVIQLNMFLREKDKEVINMGIYTERRVIGLETRGKIEIRREGKYISITIRPTSKVSIFSA